MTCKAVERVEVMRLVIHDLEPGHIDRLFPEQPLNLLVISLMRPSITCVGCFAAGLRHLAPVSSGIAMAI